MVFRYLTNGSVHQDEATRNNLQTLLFHMTALEQEVSAFNVYVVTQDILGKPLSLWPKSEQLPRLAAASQELRDTVERVKALIQAVSLQPHRGNRILTPHTHVITGCSSWGIQLYTRVRDRSVVLIC
jgi:hypothetical protein